ncbi:hypothetical protein, partial [Peptacetobacter sp.]|uniref:hypothetical protein n=1 Tax=Peptacetobacter sp. TaxID=2991975 RepID=UPI00261CCA3B
ILKLFLFDGLFNAAYFILGTFLLGLILNFIEDRNIDYLQNGLGRKGILVTGIVGVPIHEMSHFLACKLFGHDVEKVELFRPTKSKSDGVLGRVVHSRNKGNVYKMIGDFFIGTAPVIIGSFIVYVLIKFYLGSEFTIFNMIIDIEKSLEMIENLDLFKFIVHIVMAGINTLFLIISSPSLFSIKGIVLLFAIYSICIHLSLSRADIENSKSAIPIVVLIIVLCTVIFGLMGIDFSGKFIRLVTYMFLIMTTCIIISIPVTVLSMMISAIFGRFR